MFGISYINVGLAYTLNAQILLLPILASSLYPKNLNNILLI